MNHSYRKLLVMVAEAFVMKTEGFKRSSLAAQEDYRNAIQWLKDLPDEICPQVLDEQISKLSDD